VIRMSGKLSFRYIENNVNIGCNDLESFVSGEHSAKNPLYGFVVIDDQTLWLGAAGSGRARLRGKARPSWGGSTPSAASTNIARSPVTVNQVMMVRRAPARD